MEKKYRSKIFTITSFSFLLFIIDRIAKIIAKSGKTFDFFIFKFKYTSNPYIAFSLPLQGVLLYILITAGIFFVVSSLIVKFRKKDWGSFLGFCMILVGAVSNILDRIFAGVVTDYFVFLNVSVFNLADVFIVVGIIIVLISLFKNK